MSFTALYESLVSVSLPTAATTSHEEATMLMDDEKAEENGSTTKEEDDDIASTDGTEVPPDTTGKWEELPKKITVEGVQLGAYTTMAQKDGDKEPVCLYRNGHGVRTVRAPFGYNLHVYVVTIYTRVPIRSEQDVQELLFGDDNPGFVMEFTFLREITPSQMSIAWNYQLDTSVTEGDYEGYSEDRAKFLELLGDGPMAEKGVIRFEFFPSNNDTGSDESNDSAKMVLINQGEHVGEISGIDFQRAFASMWFGDVPVMDEIKAGLLQLEGALLQEDGTDGGTDNGAPSEEEEKALAELAARVELEQSQGTDEPVPAQG